MTTTIALAGKGGTGKTTLAGLLIRYLVQHRLGNVLAIDADPSSNLHLVLGAPLTRTVGDIREDARDQVPEGMARQDWLSYAVRMAVEEGDGFDLLAMGRPEGQGCYCAANHMLRTIVDGICKTYNYVVMDNEAGMEHLSRRTTRDVDVLLVVTDPTVRGVKAAEGIVKLAQDLEINVRHALLVINRVSGALPPALQEAVDGIAVDMGVVIPADPQVNEFDANGRPLVELAVDSPAARAIEALAEKIVRIPAKSG